MTETEVYADVLIILNFAVDYLLLLCVCRLFRKTARMCRLLLGAAVGAVSSLYIFLPQSHFLIELAVRAAVCAVMTLAAFGYHSFKCFIRNSLTLLAVTFIYGGAMLTLWFIFRPSGMAVNNSIVYFDISPLILIAFSVSAYFIIMLFGALFSRNSGGTDKCRVTVFAEGEHVSMDAIIDTGNSVEDVFGHSEVIIADRREIGKLIDRMGQSEREARYRVLPCTTVSGGNLLEGYRCDKALVSGAGGTVQLRKPILAVSCADLNDDFSAIVNPKIFI